jgi:hypothetical protein
MFPRERRRDDNAAWQQKTSRRPEGQAQGCLTFYDENLYIEQLRKRNSPVVKFLETT